MAYPVEKCWDVERFKDSPQYCLHQRCSERRQTFWIALFQLNALLCKLSLGCCCLATTSTMAQVVRKRVFPECSRLSINWKLVESLTFVDLPRTSRSSWNRSRFRTRKPWGSARSWWSMCFLGFELSFRSLAIKAEFYNKKLKGLCEIMGVDQLRNTPYKVSIYGAIDRFHRPRNAMLDMILQVIYIGT